MATLEEMDGKLDVIITSIATINQRCVDRGKTIDGHRKTLYGENGLGGLVAKVTTLNGVSTSRKEWAMRIVGPIISALVVAAVLGGLMLWKLN